VDQASLLSGYQTIAKSIGSQKGNPIKSAKSVISWLQDSEGSWLLVIDHLDDFKVAEGFLPTNGSMKHTLVTTRNHLVHEIDAQPLEVPLLDSQDAVALFSAVSSLKATPDSIEFQQMAGLLAEARQEPLAIEQLAAYLREGRKGLTQCRKMYELYRNDFGKRTQTTRRYPLSVAISSSMALTLLQPHNKRAIEMIRLLSFLNSEVVMTDFLLPGIGATNETMRDLLNDDRTAAKTLLELEKLALIKWDQGHRTISIHRLVQSLVRDNMPYSEGIRVYFAATKLCSRVFGPPVDNDKRVLQEKYQNQALELVLRHPVVPTKGYAILQQHVGAFLCEQGKYKDGEKLLEASAEMCINLKEYGSALNSQEHLAKAYTKQGRIAESNMLRLNIRQGRLMIVKEKVDEFNAVHLAFTLCVIM